MRLCLRRREFIAGLGGSAAWPLAAGAQQSALPVIAFINLSAADPAQEASFRKGLAEAGAVGWRASTIACRRW